MWHLAHCASPFTTALSVDYVSSAVAGQGYLSPMASDGTAWPATPARTCLHTPGPGPSARSSAPSYLLLAGRSHHGEPLTHGSMTAWSDSAPWPVAHTECPPRALQGLKRLPACWASSLMAPHPPRDPPTGRCPAFPSPR